MRSTNCFRTGTGTNKIGRQEDRTKLGDKGIAQNWETGGQNKIGRQEDRTKLEDMGIEQNWETRGQNKIGKQGDGAAKKSEGLSNLWINIIVIVPHDLLYIDTTLIKESLTKTYARWNVL